MERLRYEIDDRGTLGITLMEFKSLREMDDFMKRFHDSNDVREYFFTKIDTFLKKPEARRFFDTPAKGGRERNGYIICYHEDKYHKMRRISCLYDNELITNNLYTKLREALKDIKVLKEIYERKYYLLPSDFSKAELRRVVVNHGGASAFIDDFIRYIHSLNEENQYVYIRSLCDICNLLVYPKVKTVVRLKVVNTSNIEGISEYSLVDIGEKDYVIDDLEEFQYEVSPDAPEYFKLIFDEAVKKDDYERLFNEFTHEEIDLYSNFYRKGRSK